MARMADLPAPLVESLKTLDPDIAQRLTDALLPVAGELGPREEAVLERLVKGIADGAPAAAGVSDGLYAADTAGHGRGLTRLFYQAPTGAEVCGPRFTPDGETIFLAIQHPGEDTGSSFDRPSTRWPDFEPTMPPRPSVIAITRKGGGEIGS